MPHGSLSPSQHVELLRDEADRFAASLTSADLAATVVTCRDWTVRDLVSHVGGVHRWTTGLVVNGIVAETWRSALPLEYPADTAPLATWHDWFVAGAEDACRAFAAADPDRPVWAWGADQHVRFWPRRMLFETAAHRLDLDMTLGIAPDLPIELSLEGVDEHLGNLPFVARWNDEVGRLRGRGETLGFRASDTAASWRVRLDAGGWWWDRAAGDDDVTVEGTALALLLLLLGRPAPGVKVTGDRALLERWRAATAF